MSPVAHIAAITPNVPACPAPTAGQLYGYQHAALLQHRFRVSILAPDTTENLAYARAPGELKSVYLWRCTSERRIIKRVWNYGRFLTAGLGPARTTAVSLLKDEYARAVLASADIIELHYPTALVWVSELRKLYSHTPITVICYDVYSDSLAKLSKNARSLRQRGEAVVRLIRARSQEARWLSLTDCAMVFSARDAALLHELGATCPVEVISPYIDAPEMEPPAGGGCVLFVAAFGLPQNEDSALWLIESVWPAVRAQIPSARLLLVGSNPRERLRRLQGNGVEVIGYAADLEPYYRQADVAVAPIQFGAGVKFKVLHALARGRPVVATSIGVEGIQLPHDTPALRVADNPREFAKELVAALRTSDGQTVADVARGLITTSYDFPSSMEEVALRYTRILRQAPTPG